MPKYSRLSRLHVFKYYLAFEALPFIMLTFLILTLLILAQQISRQSEIFLGSTASIYLTVRLILTILPGIIVITLPFSLLIGSLMALNRLSADSEVIAAQASGISLFRLTRPLLFCATVGALLSSYLTLVVIPQMFADAKQIKKDLLLNALTAPIIPQSFNTNFPNTLIFIREIQKETGDWLGVFIVRKIEAQDGNSKSLVLTASRAKLRLTETAPLTIELELLNGILATISSQSPEKQTIVRFSNQEFKLSSGSPGVSQAIEKELSSQESSLNQLSNKSRAAESPQERRQAQVELQKRLSLPVACIILVLLAIPLGSTTTRKSGRAVAFALGFMLAIAYYLILMAGQNLALSGGLPAWFGVWLPNIMGTIAFFYLTITLTWPTKHFRSIKPPQQQAANLSTKTAPTKPNINFNRLSIFFNRATTSLFPGIINYLLLSEMIKYLSLCSIVLVSTSLIFTLFDLMPSLARSNLGYSIAATYLLYLAPQIYYFTAPFSVLLAALITHGVLTRSGQVTALLAGGQSYLRLSMPFITCALIIIVSLFWLSEYVLPTANREQDARYNLIKNRRTDQAIMAFGQRWVRGRDNTIYAFQYNPETKQLLNTIAYRLNPEDSVLRSVIYAQETSPLRENTWQIFSGWKLQINSDIQITFNSIKDRKDEELLTVPDGNVLFSRIVNEASKMSFYELRTYIYYLSQLNTSTTSLRVDLEKKVSFPFSIFPLIILAAPIALRNSRRKPLAGIGLSIIIGLSYWVIASIFESLGRQAFLPPGLSVWGPHALFTALGIFIIFRQK